MIMHGMEFKHASKYMWKEIGRQTKLQKNLSVYFSVDNPCTSQEIIEAFDKAGIDIDIIVSIQQKASNKSFRHLNGGNWWLSRFSW